MRSPASDSRQRAHQRDATGDRRLEQEVDAGAFGGLEQRRGRDVPSSSLFAVTTGLPAIERVDDERPGRLDAADDLDDDVDVGIADHALGVVGEAVRREREPAVFREVADRDPRDLERHAGARLDHVGVIVDEPHERAPHVPAAEDPDPNPFLHDGSVSHVVAGHEILVGLPAHDEPRIAVVDEDDRRPRQEVVVGCHRVAVRAR